MSSTAWILCKLWTPLLKSVTEEAFHRIQEKFHFLSGNIEARDGPLEKWLGGGVGNCQLARIFFSLLVFSLLVCVSLLVCFFAGETLCTNLFFREILLFFWTVKSWFVIYVFVLYKLLFYTHNRSKDTAHFLTQNLFQNVHTFYTQSERRKPLRGGRLPCALLQSFPSGIPLHSPS